MASAFSLSVVDAADAQRTKHKHIASTSVRQALFLLTDIMLTVWRSVICANLSQKDTMGRCCTNRQSDDAAAALNSKKYVRCGTSAACCRGWWFQAKFENIITPLTLCAAFTAAKSQASFPAITRRTLWIIERCHHLSNCVVAKFAEVY